jgi:hypothetical protein
VDVSIESKKCSESETNIAIIGSVFSNLAKDIVGDLNIARLRWAAGDGLFQVAVLSGIPHFRVDLHCRCGIVAEGTDLTDGQTD